MRSPKSHLLVALLSTLACSAVLAAPRYPIRSLPSVFGDAQNTVVTVEGVAANFAPLMNPEVKFKCEYTLSRDGATVKVLSNRQPKLNELISVTGKLRGTAAEPTIEQSSGLDVSDWRVWALGALLVIAVILLVVLLAPKRDGATAEVHPGPASASQPVGGAGGPGPISTMLCPHCNASILADSLRCDQCGQALSASGGYSEPPIGDGLTIMPGSRPATVGSQETVLIQPVGEQPIADLTVTESGGSAMRHGEQFKLTTTKRRIGRGPDADIRVIDDTVSREHAVIWWLDGAFYVQDDASRAGTFVNGQKITGQTRLTNGDEILLGKTKLVFRAL